MAIMALLILAAPLQAPAAVVWFGQNSHLTRPVVKLIQTKRDWANTWLTHAGAKRRAGDTEFEFYNEHAIPMADFGRFMVLAVFGGRETNNAGYGLYGVSGHREGLRVRIVPHAFQTGGPDGGAVSTTPYGMFLLPRSDKTVIVEEPIYEGMRIKGWKVKAKLRPRA
jgi:hypothetical protein